MSVKDNILVTPQVVAGRIQPWRAKERPQDGLWVFASQMNKAQDRAELRRKFYVALTRVKDRLILTGAPGNASTFDEETGEFAVRFAPDSRTMGRMLVEGLRRASWKAGDGAAPWLTQKDLEATELGTLFKPARSQTAVNPAHLLSNTPLGEDGVHGLRLYHHPSCFDTVQPPSAQQRARALRRIFQPTAQRCPSHRHQAWLWRKTFAGQHTIWTARYDCQRKYWLEHIKGWSTEPFELPNPKPTSTRDVPWPEPTEFGLMMHRVLEIGLRNPLNFDDRTPLLDPSWTHVSEDDLATRTTVARVMNEFGYGLEQEDGTPQAAWRDRLLHMAGLIDARIAGSPCWRRIPSGMVG